jgi:hypothetical protein
MATQRPKVAFIRDDTMERVDEYAVDNGLRRERAYGELIERGLDAEGYRHAGETEGSDNA